MLRSARPSAEILPGDIENHAAVEIVPAHTDILHRACRDLVGAVDPRGFNQRAFAGAGLTDQHDPWNAVAAPARGQIRLDMSDRTGEGPSQGGHAAAGRSLRITTCLRGCPLSRKEDHIPQQQHGQQDENGNTDDVIVHHRDALRSDSVSPMLSADLISRESVVWPEPLDSLSRLP